MRYYTEPKIVDFAHADGVSTEALCHAIAHARSLPIDRTSACVGGLLSYDAHGRPLTDEAPDAEIHESITIHVAFAHQEVPRL